MNILPMVFCFGYGVSGLNPPPPTPEITGLIKQLGEDYYFHREQAQTKLAKIGYPALAALEVTVLSHPCPETRRRAQVLISNIYSINWRHPVPHIYKLPNWQMEINGRRYHFLPGTAKKYYRKYFKPFVWEHDDEKLKMMTTDLVRNLIRSGVPKEDVVELLERMKNDKFQFFYDMQSQMDASDPEWWIRRANELYYEFYFGVERWLYGHTTGQEGGCGN